LRRYTAELSEELFVSKDELNALQERVAQLEAHIAQLTAAVAPARALLDDSRRLEELGERAARLSAAADSALLGIQQLATSTGVALPRTRPAFNTVYQAEATGYVSLFFTGGRTDILQLLAGPDNPPTECICEANTRNDLNSYAGGIVRKGEYWTVVSRTGLRSGVECVFTPLF
jgi:hypothetical protein